jgi:N utilization substance protein A
MSLTGISANRLELLQIADAVAREKSIDREIVIEAIEEAIQKGARARYGAEHDIRVSIDQKTGEVSIKRIQTVVADDANYGVVVGEDGEETPAEEPQGIIRLSEAKRADKDAVVGKTYEEVLPPFEFGRVQTQMARQVVTGKVREAERERQYEEFKDRVGEIVNGVVKRVEYGNIVVDLGRGEGIARRDQSIPRENFNIGDRIRCYIYDVRRETKGPQILLSRAHGGFMAKLFAQEVPEVYDGVIEIRAVARDPGSRAKMAVVSNDSSIDPVGACVGMRGSRVQAVVAELQGEKIDIIQWSPDEATFIVNALAPAEVSKVVMDEERPSRQPADRLADRHHDREPGERAPPARVRRAHPALPGSPGRGRGDRPAAGHRRLRHRRGRGLCRRLGDRLH